MDSLSQLALGSAATVAALGHRVPLRRAVAWGAVAGTLPDLDAFIDYGDAVLNMTRHRAESHSLIYLTLLAPVLAGLISRLHREPALFGRWCLAMWLALFTHPLLDWFTIYGTQLFQPFTDHPFGLGSIFIIDPLFTLPIILGLIVAACLRNPARRARANWTGLGLASVYLAWSVLAQQHVIGVAERALPQDVQGSSYRLLVTPAPFNTVLWRLVVVTDDAYYEGWHSLLDRADAGPMWRRYDRGADLMAIHGSIEGAQRIASFSKGFYSMDQRAGRLFITDLRMGQEPFYSFRFDLGEIGRPAALTQLERVRPPVANALPWLWARTLGDVNADSLRITVEGSSRPVR